MVIANNARTTDEYNCLVYQEKYMPNVLTLFYTEVKKKPKKSLKKALRIN